MQQGMAPISAQIMLNFLHWVAKNRPDVLSFASLSRADLLKLANEFETSKLKTIPHPRRQWEISFEHLLSGNGGRGDYDSIRK
jgi:hypothetical protein